MAKLVPTYEDGVWTTEEESGGGGSQPVTARAQYRKTTSVAGDGSFVLLGWTKVSGDALLDLSDITQPAVVTGGVYAVSCSVAFSGTINAPFNVYVEIDLDNDGEDAEINAGAQFPTAPLGTIRPEIPISQTYYIPAGGVIAVGVKQDSGGATNVVLVATVQKIQDAET